MGKRERPVVSIPFETMQWPPRELIVCKSQTPKPKEMHPFIESKNGKPVENNLIAVNALPPLPGMRMHGLLP